MAKEKILIGNNDEIVELKGADLEAFIKQREEDLLEFNKIQSQIKAQKELKISAYKKLGLTDEEIQAII